MKQLFSFFCIDWVMKHYFCAATRPYLLICSRLRVRHLSPSGHWSPIPCRTYNWPAWVSSQSACGAADMQDTSSALHGKAITCKKHFLWKSFLFIKLCLDCGEFFTTVIPSCISMSICCFYGTTCVIIPTTLNTTLRGGSTVKIAMLIYKIVLLVTFIRNEDDFQLR